MKTENLKVGDVLIAIVKNNFLTKYKEYIIDEIAFDKGIVIKCDDVYRWFCVDTLDKFFELKQHKGKHIGYIYPFETFCEVKVTDKIIYLKSYRDGSYCLEVGENQYTLFAKEIVETFEKYHEPVEEKITIGGYEVELNAMYADVNIGKSGYSISEIRHILKLIQLEPNLKEKLQLIINKMEK